MSRYGQVPTAKLSTRQVADRLGVKPETVYAYVSRGLLHSVREQGGRGSWFDQAEVDALAARSRLGRQEPPGQADPQGRSGLAAGGRGAAGQPVIATGLTQMKDGKLYYRGLEVARLARTESFESVVGLLWTGSLGRPPTFAAPAATVQIVRTVRAALPASARLTDLLRIVPAVGSATDPLRFDTRPGPVVAAAATLIAMLIDALPYADGSDACGRTAERAQSAESPSLARRLWPKLTARTATPERIKALNAALIVLADHDLAVSTLAGRVAASARAHPYAVVSAALGAFDGPLHGAAGSHSYRLLADALASGDPVGAYADRLRTQGWVEGFGHPAYPDGDPRATVLLDLLDQSATLRPELRAVAESLIETAHRHGRDLPNVDFALPVLTHVYEMVPDAGEVIFIVARTAGWIAHALEEYEEPPLRFRYQGTYRGPAPTD
ncbi:MAG TPA: citrate synthase [Actinocrinis sp.]|nr:citrate synthase [Actinocrinis sp.]